jgi:hypothetical protein
VINSNTLFPLNQAVYPPFSKYPLSKKFLSLCEITTYAPLLFSPKIGSKSEAKLAAVAYIEGVL